MSATDTKEHPTRPPDLVIVPRRHSGRWVSATIVAAMVLWFIWALATAEAFRWDVVWANLFSDKVLEGVKGTLVMTALAMVIGMVLGTVIAIMRLSSNPVLTTVASGYQWLFRGLPTLVQLVFWFNLASVFPSFTLNLFGFTIFDVQTNTVMTPFLAALLGLGLNFAAYYSEIVRAGILSVDEGQAEAAVAYGLSRGRTLRHIVLPQAMRVIIPPTGNELIGMLKWTSLASVVAYVELLHSVQNIYALTYQVIPMLMVAAIWYLLLTTILSIGQHFLEKRFARGTQRTPSRGALERLIQRVRGATA